MPPPSAAPPDSGLSPYETAQQAANRPKFPPALETIAAPWLPYVRACLRDGQPSVKLLRGEKSRVRCERGDVVFMFVKYTSVAERDKVRIANLSKNVDARQLTPGVAGQREGPTPSGHTAGDYVEYAYTLPAGATGVPVAALWWDDASPGGRVHDRVLEGQARRSWDPTGPVGRARLTEGCDSAGWRAVRRPPWRSRSSSGELRHVPTARWQAETA